MRPQRCRRPGLLELLEAFVSTVGDACLWLVLIAGYLLAVSLLYLVLVTPVPAAPPTSMEMWATAYSWREREHRRWGTRNALGGSLARPLEGLGHCAVDRRVVPLGSILEIPGAGRRIATDTGRLILGRDLDVHFDSLVGMWAWEARRVEVKILRWGWGKRINVAHGPIRPLDHRCPNPRCLITRARR